MGLQAISRKRYKEKFSNNWKKQKEKVQTIYSKIANIRTDALHKASTEISKNHAMPVGIQTKKTVCLNQSSSVCNVVMKLMSTAMQH